MGTYSEFIYAEENYLITITQLIAQAIIVAIIVRDTIFIFGMRTTAGVVGRH